jgi:hypothetical protein
MDLVIFSIAAVLLVVALVVARWFIIRWRRNAYRFSLRGLLFTFVVVACALFVAIRFVVPAINHRWAVYNIDRYGEIIFLNDFHAGGVSASNKSFSRWRDVDDVYVTSDQAALDLVKQLRSLPEAKQVTIGSGVTNAGLAAICELDQHPSLEGLQLMLAPVTDNGFSHVAKLSRLKNVFVNTSPIGDSALETLKEINGLQMLGLIEEGTTANSRRFSERGFAAIGQLKELKLLRLVGYRISDASASHLTSLNQLKTLQIIHCWMSEDAVAAIRQALPDCDIEIHAPQPPMPSGK